jgi:hypothetical protein
MKYLATGRVLPERAWVSFGPVHWRYGESGRVSAYSDSAQLSVQLDVPDLNDTSSAYIAAEHFAHIAVSSLGFSLGSAYSVELTQVFEENGTPHVFGVRHQDLVYDPHLDIFNRSILQATEDVFFRLALRDYVRAIVDSTDCANYCYRAIEAIKSSFAFRTNLDGWIEMHTALGTDRNSIEATVKAYADPIRHGNWISAKFTNGAIRTAMLNLTREILEKYLNHVRPAA